MAGAYVDESAFRTLSNANADANSVDLTQTILSLKQSVENLKAAVAYLEQEAKRLKSQEDTNKNN